ARGFERHVELAWAAPDERPFYYLVERSLDGGDFEPAGVRQPVFNRHVDWLGEPDQEARYRVRACDLADRCSPPSNVAAATTRAMTDEDRKSTRLNSSH